MPRKLSTFQEQRNAAMPEVRALVKKHGLKVVGSCITRLRELRREEAELEAARKRVQELERRIGA